MPTIIFPRDQIFSGWGDGEDSRIVEKFKEKEFVHVSEHVEEIRKRIAQHHVNETPEPYFYSVKSVRALDQGDGYLTNNQKFYLTVALCVVVSLFVFWATGSYFEDKWKECQEIAARKEYIIKSYGMNRGYATARELWGYFPSAGFAFFYRNIFCAVFPIAGYLWAAKYFTEYCYNLIVERTEDDRICPSNFNIEEDADPLTQESIPEDDLQSPKMLYLPNYVTEAKSFVLALLMKGQIATSDPVYKKKFSEKEQKEILSQIKKIFHIPKQDFRDCFDLEPFLFYRDYDTDPRVFDENGQLAQEAEKYLKDLYFDDYQQIDSFVKSQQITEDQRKNLWTTLLNNVQYFDKLIAEDEEQEIANYRIRNFEEFTGVLLKV